MDILLQKIIKPAIFCRLLLFSFLLPVKTYGQNTIIKGFADALISYDTKASFGFDEQDLFITSQLNDRFSFLGESVFRYDKSTASNFAVSIERLIVKYNYYGNHNIVIGKVHTPLSYWNDMYHHGRVFYPTIERPLLFAAGIIPLHSTGINFQGHDLGNLKFGYDFMIANGLGSAPVSDNDKHKSITAAVHIKPVEKMQIGVSYYNDVVSKGATAEGKTLNWKVNQQLFTASFACFENKFELLAESTAALNHTDTTGTKHTFGSYLYAGYKITQNIIPYIRFDNLHYQNGEIFFTKDNTTAFVVGLRYKINYLAVVKLEYQNTKREIEGSDNKVTLQVAIGF